jgi:hypothetical protein
MDQTTIAEHAKFGAMHEMYHSRRRPDDRRRLITLSCSPPGVPIGQR